MRLLLDTHVLIDLARRRQGKLHPIFATAVSSPDNTCFASVASIWEIAVKTRLGKLDPGMALDDLPGFFASVGLGLVVINQHHAIAEAQPTPDTKDPFDRLLLGQCLVEGMLLATLDLKLVTHRLAWRPT